MQHLGEVQHVLADFVAARLAKVEKIQQLHVEADSMAADHDVVVVNVAMIFAARVDRSNALGQFVQNVKCLESAQSLAGLRGEEFAQLLSLDQFADDHRDLAPMHHGQFLVVILHQDGAMPQGIQLAGIADGGLAGWIAEGIVKLGRPVDAGSPLDNRINLALPTTSERSVDLVLSGDDAAGRKVEAIDFPARRLHGLEIIQRSVKTVNRPAILKSSGVYKGW